MKIDIPNLENLPLAVEQFMAAMGDRRVFAFYGKMGAGKTTFISALCEALEVEDAVASPTFAIVNEYFSNKLQEPVYHFDFYRIKNLAEAVDIGTDDYFYSGCLCFIEWPELIEPLLPEDCAVVTISECKDKRILEISE